MRSRGANLWQVLALAGVEALLLCSSALLFAPLLAHQVTGFLIHFTFLGTAQSSLSGFLPLPTVYWYAGAAAIICFLILLIPVLSTTRVSLLAIKHETARPRRLAAPLRLAPNLLLTALGTLGFFELHQQSVFFIERMNGRPLINWVVVLSPLLLLLGVVGLCLLLFPVLLTLLDRLNQRLPSITGALATRQMVRRPSLYNRLALLLSLTLALGVFAVLLSGTLLNSFADRASYLSGSDLRLVEGQTGQPDADRQAAPLEDHLTLIPGAIDGMNLFRDGDLASLGGAAPGAGNQLTMLGVDSRKFASLAFWRADFASQSLSSLMAALRQPIAVNDAVPVLLDDRLLQDSGKHVGEEINIKLNETIAVDFVIVGTFHYFPTLDTSQEAVVCDLTRLVQGVSQTGLTSIAPNEVWLKLAPTAPEYTANQVENLLMHNPQHQQVIVTVQQAYDRAALAQSLRNDPLHLAIAGTLVLDFIVTALLSVLGFVVFFSLLIQRRAFEFGVLRVLGLSLRQLAGSLGWEQVIVIGASSILGVGGGMFLALQVIPALSTDETGKPLLPPFTVGVNGQAILLISCFFLACLIAAMVAAVLLFRRLKLQELLRLGEE